MPQPAVARLYFTIASRDVYSRKNGSLLVFIIIDFARRVTPNRVAEVSRSFGRHFRHSTQAQHRYAFHQAWMAAAGILCLATEFCLRK